MNSAACVTVIMPLLILLANTSMAMAIEIVNALSGLITYISIGTCRISRRLTWFVQRTAPGQIGLYIPDKRHILYYIPAVPSGTVTMAKTRSKAERLKQNDSLNLHPERVNAPHFRNSVFFDALDLVQVKYEMLRQVNHEGTPKTQAAALYGMSRPTLYQAINAFNRDGVAGLLPQRRGPKGAHKLTDEVMEFVVRRQAEDPTLYARALAKTLREEKHLSVHPRSIERALGRKKKR